MDKQVETIIFLALIPNVISYVQNKFNMTETEALESFYLSQTCKLLKQEETKLWHYSPLTLFMMYEEEKSSGEIIPPEEAA